MKSLNLQKKRKKSQTGKRTKNVMIMKITKIFISKYKFFK